MKIKKEFVILILIIIALSLYIVFRKSDKTHYELPTIEEIADNQISKIEILKGGKTLSVYKDGEEWKISPRGYLAADYVVDNMLEIIQNLKLTTLISESRDYDRYDLNNDKKITVRAWAGENLIREFDIGKVHEPSNQTFVKISGNTRVYHAKEEFRWKFDQTLDSLRDKSVMAFDRDRISEFTITRDGKSYGFTRVEDTEHEEVSSDEKKAEPETYWQDSNGVVLEKDKVDGFLKILSELSCEKYIEGMEKADFQNPIISIQLTGEKEYTVIVYPKQDNENDEFYPAISSENDYPFFLPEWAEEEIFKSPESMFILSEDSEGSDAD